MRIQVEGVRLVAVAALFAVVACGEDSGTTGSIVSGDAIVNGDTGPKDDIGNDEADTTPGPGADTSVTDVGPSDGCTPSWFGSNCTDHGQCAGGATECLGVEGFCVDGTCTMSCIETCPTGYGCQANAQLGPDSPSVCMPEAEVNCDECETDADCAVEGARCIQIGFEGGLADLRCAMDCSQGQPCGDDYQCVTQPGDAGNASQLCVPKTDSCICIGDIDGTEQDCSKSAEGIGTCYGKQICEGENGWGACSAQEPAAETCNGTDDDCDGKKDEAEDLSLGPCSVTNDFGTCDGTKACTDGSEVCTAKSPGAESCNGEDDDCDGAVDEDMADADEDGTCDDQDSDDDGDLVPDATDNCDYAANSDQADSDKDGIGDACEDDCDSDDVPDASDNCKCEPNADQKDFDKDLLGDVCDADKDNDGKEPPSDCNDFDASTYTGATELCDGYDNTCNNLIDEGFIDSDNDQSKDCIDTDDDNDGAADADDCAPTDPTISSGATEVCNGVDDDCDTEIDEGFADTDDDGTCDDIDPDTDGDQFDNEQDNCPNVSNPDQANNDNDAFGDLCDTDDDNDKVIDPDDNCANIANQDQTNLDGDALGDACDKDDDGDGKDEGSGSDCNDKDPAIYFGAAEVCDDKDNGCNGSIDEGFPDTDGDQKKDCVDADDDGDTYPDSQDCEPLNASINPEAVEACDGFDNNCNLEIDEDCPPTSVQLIFPSAVVTGTTASGLKATITIGMPGVVGTSAPSGGSGYQVDWGFYYTLP